MRSLAVICVSLAAFCSGCSSDDNDMPARSHDQPLDPDTAPRVEVDRFSAQAAMLMVRTADNGLPGPNEPIDFDSGAPFVTPGFGPNGGVVRYYNFDVQSRTPAPILRVMSPIR